MKIMGNDWNIIECDSKSNLFYLSNNRTEIKINKRIKFDIVEFMSKLEELKVPSKYVEELDKINFTILKNNDNSIIHGDYYNNEIRVSCNNDFSISPIRAFIHEVGHHVDFTDDISTKDHIINEWKKNRINFKKFNFISNAEEYVATGFELYYCGNKKEKKTLREKYPKLYRAVLKSHNLRTK